MITIIYDAYAGVSIPDGKVQDTVYEWIEINSHKNSIYHTSTGLVIDAMRLAIKNCMIPTRDVLFVFNDMAFQANEYGQFETWPKGFCDTHDMLLIGLLEY